MQAEKILLIIFILLVFHFDISGNDSNDEHPKNNPENLSNFSVFQLEMSGIDINE